MLGASGSARESRRPRVLRNPRVWLYAAGLWLVLGGLAHMGGHVYGIVLENGMIGQREFAMNAMKQAFSTDLLEPSLWTLFRAFSVSFGLLLLFSGLVAVLLAWTYAEARTIRAFALFGTVFWTFAFVPFAFVDPVIQPIVLSIVAVPLHALAYVTASAQTAAD